MSQFWLTYNALKSLFFRELYVSRLARTTSPV